VVEVLQDSEPLLDDQMRLQALDMGDKTHAARIVFVNWIVESLGKGRVIQGLPLKAINSRCAAGRR
jgi:hypothetical protein